MIKFLNSKNSVKGATLILIVTLTLSNLLGMLRDHFLAQKIIAADLDIYYAAFRIPDLVFNVIIMGAISAAFIPIFAGFVARDEKKRAWDVANSVINIGLIATAIAIVILFFLMPWLVKILVPQFDLDRQNQTIHLSRLFLATPLLFTISYIIGGILNSFKRFIFYSIAPLIYNLSIIVATIFLASRWGISGVAVGVIFGAFFHMIIQLPGVFHLGWKYNFKANFYDPSVRQIGKLMIPRAIGLGTNQLMLFVFTAIASTLAVGSVAIYNLTDNIQTMPSVVFGASLATAIFPTLAEKAALGAREEFSVYLNRSIRTILFLLIPAAIGIIMLRTELIRLILGSGRFGWDETVMAASTLGFFALSLPFSGLIPVLAKAFYARHDTKTPVVIAVVSIVISIIFAYIFSNTGLDGFGGTVSSLALAFSIGSFINAILLFIMITKDRWLEKSSQILVASLKITVATAVMAASIQVTKNLLGGQVDMQRFWGVAVKTIGAISIGTLFYFLTGYLLKLEEASLVSLKKIFSSRFGKFSTSGYNDSSETVETVQK